MRFDGKHTRESGLQKLFFYWTKWGDESSFALVFQEKQLPRFARDDNVE